MIEWAYNDGSPAKQPQDADHWRKLITEHFGAGVRAKFVWVADGQPWYLARAEQPERAHVGGLSSNSPQDVTAAVREMLIAAGKPVAP